ncbi:dihydroorotate dehydrogenase [Mycoblastus sanguinarius]|nr:dihydroorotate dehydrogenase [Mycoblastus sanguinarius]
MPLSFKPPLVNSANPWATTKEDLQALYDSPHTGAITTRTALINGFSHDNTIHQYCFVEPQTHSVLSHSERLPSKDSAPDQPTQSVSSLNTLGYSPFSLLQYLQFISEILQTSQASQIPHPKPKPVIFSVTGPPSEVVKAYISISTLQSTLKYKHSISSNFLMEINLSCPNIADKPPPAYSKPELLKYLAPLRDFAPDPEGDVRVGIKTPPYTYQTQFDEVISALLESSQHRGCPIAFITATNTLGSSLVLSSANIPALNSSNGTGIGGLAGSALHPLALGNVATLRRMLDAHNELKQIDIIGVGGVSDGAGFERMRSVGAAAVGVGTALGVEGVGVFGRIWGDVEEGGRG